MNLVQTAINAGVIAALGTLFAAYISSQTKDLKKDLKNDLGLLRRDLGVLRHDVGADIGGVKQEIRDLRSEMNDRFRDQGNEISALRADVTQVALALSARPHPQAG